MRRGLNFLTRKCCRLLAIFILCCVSVFYNFMCNVQIISIQVPNSVEDEEKCWQKTVKSLNGKCRTSRFSVRERSMVDSAADMD